MLIISVCTHSQVCMSAWISPCSSALLGCLTGILSLMDSESNSWYSPPNLLYLLVAEAKPIELSLTLLFFALPYLSHQQILSAPTFKIHPESNCPHHCGLKYHHSFPARLPLQPRAPCIDISFSRCEFKACIRWTFLNSTVAPLHSG